MKQTKRRFLSLLMALVMVLSLAPTALAEVSVTISGDTSNKTDGDKVTLSASVTGADDYSNLTYSWSISGGTPTSATTASVEITCSAGTVNATVTVKGTKDETETEIGSQSTSFTVASATVDVQTVSVTPSTATVKVGATTQLSATVAPNNATDKDVTWTSDKTDVATVDQTGKVTGVAKGEATITATAGGKSGTCTVTVTEPVTPSDITLNSGNATTMKVGQKNVTWGYTFSPDNAEGEVTWTSSDETVATVNGGKITALKAGTTDISVALKDSTTVKATATLTVTEDVAATLKSSTTKPQANGSIEVQLTVTSGKDQVKSVSWSVDNGATKTSETNYNSTSGTATATISLKKTGKTTITATLVGQDDKTITTKTLDVTVETPLTITASNSLTSYGETATLTAKLNGNTIGDSSVSWNIGSSSGLTTTTNDYISLSDNRNGTATIRAYANTPSNSPTRVWASYTKDGETYVAYYDVTVKFSAQIDVSATVYDDNSGYSLADIPDEGRTSIADQISNRVRNLYNSSNYSYYEVDFTGSMGSSSSKVGYLDATTKDSYEEDDLEDVYFVPTATLSSSTAKEEVSFTFTVTVRNSSGKVAATYSGLMTFTVKQGDSTSGDIFFSGSKGEDVTLDMDAFEDFWTDYQSKGSLSYIEIDSISGGKLYTYDGKQVSTGTSLHVDPTSRQRDLSGIYFTPTSKTTSSAKITFTAYGSRSGSASSSYTRKGTVAISFLSGAASAITYSTSANGTATLKAQDFIDAYKEATGSKSNPSNLTIQFQSVPSYGTLTYNDSSKKNAKDVKLTSSNIKSYKFNTKSSGSNQLGDVTYTVSGSRTETISYVGYVGSTATFTGEVTFNTVTAPTNVAVSFTCLSASGVALTPSYFTSANTAMANATYVILGTPRMGRLTNTSGTSAINTPIAINLLGGVTYVPTTAVAGVASTDSFTFTAYNASNVVVASGTVNMTVSLPASVTTGAITSITQLTDVPATAAASWYRDKLSYLISRGMINGKGNGKFGPEDSVEYSEALKFIMNAAGYYEQQSTVGNWAQNYKNTAVQRGWMDSSVDITKPISRTAMAELAARILGISKSTAQSPFADINDGWATALFNATFTINGTTNRIIQGDLWDNGQRMFNPNKALTRDEMVCLVYNMYQYTGK